MKTGLAFASGVAVVGVPAVTLDRASADEKAAWSQAGREQAKLSNEWGFAGPPGSEDAYNEFGAF